MGFASFCQRLFCVLHVLCSNYVYRTTFGLVQIALFVHKYSNPLERTGLYPPEVEVGISSPEIPSNLSFPMVLTLQYVDVQSDAKLYKLLCNTGGGVWNPRPAYSY